MMIGLEESITSGGRRLEVAWPARRWTPELRREYAEALRAIGDPMAITAGVGRSIREWGGDFPPSVATLCEIVWEEQRRRLERLRLREQAEQRDARYQGPVAPAWWARLVCAALLASCESRDQVTRVPLRTVPYLEIARRHDLRPADLAGIDPAADAEWRVKRAIAEAREYGERVDPGPSGPDELDELTGGIGA